MISTYQLFVILALYSIALTFVLYSVNRYFNRPVSEASEQKFRKDLEAKSESLSLEREQLETLMGALTDGILALDTDENPLFFNGQFAVLIGRENLNRENMKLWEIFRDPEILTSFRRALKEGRTSTSNATPFDQDTGRKFYSLSVAPLRRPDRSIYGAVGIFHDVTDLKNAEQMRMDFVANVSHELRTPLTAIKGYSDTLVDDTRQGRPVDMDFLDIIVRNVDRLMSLISDLLDLSSLDSATDVLQKESIVTEDITLRVVTQMHGAFEKKNQKVTIKAAAGTVFADLRRLDQVLVNLLDNAHKYTPAAGEITVLWEPVANGDVLLKVVDSGPGIHPEHHSRLFERFYRVDKARSREMGGTGLGLAIVKHIMQRHGGAIWVKSEMGRGASFVCRFPATTFKPS